MKNYIQPGDTITLTAPTDITSGGGVLVGSIFGIACNDAAADTEVETKLTGVFIVQKVAAEAWSVGNLIYWSQSEKLATTAAVDNTLIGVAIGASANPSGAGTVRLNGAFVNPSPTKAHLVTNVVRGDSAGVFNTTASKP